jgi:DNA replication factor GINS
LDEFFQKLREIQKKERNLSGLAPVGEDFYHNISRYFNALMRKIDNNPFSFESYLLRDAQRITAEICERREHKISNSAVMSVQRSYRLFKESDSDSDSDKDIIQKIPRNATPEEENLYHALIDSLIDHREKMRGPLKFNTDKANGFDLITDDSTSKDMDIEGQRNTESITETDVDIKRSERSETDENIKEPQKKGKDISNQQITDEKEFQVLKTPDNIEEEINGYTPEEEAAIDDNIYKQFGNEPFPGDKLSKSKVKQPHQSNYIDKDKDRRRKGNGQLNVLENKKNNQTDILLVLEELPSIMGVDKNVYGPLLPQDIVNIPEPTARILIKNQKGKSIQKYK